MLKIIGALIIMISTTTAGIIYIKQKKSQLKQLVLTISFFEKLKEDLTYNFNDISDSINKCCEDIEFEHKGAFITFSEEIKKSDTDTFTNAWKNCLTAKSYSNTTVELLDNYSKKLDVGGANFHKEATAKILEELAAEHCEQLKKTKTDNKLILNICICFGILIVIALI